MIREQWLGNHNEDVVVIYEMEPIFRKLIGRLIPYIDYEMESVTLPP